jgi:hypothetical protein
VRQQPLVFPSVAGVALGSATWFQRDLQDLSESAEGSPASNSGPESEVGPAGGCGEDGGSGWARATASHASSNDTLHPPAGGWLGADFVRTLARRR